MSATQKHYLNFAIGFIFMFFFQLLPAPAPITPYGIFHKNEDEQPSPSQ